MTKTNTRTIKNIRSAPPGGKWVWSDPDHHIEAFGYEEAVDRIMAEMKCDRRKAMNLLGEYMCRHMPEGFCYGTSSDEPRGASIPYYLDRARPYLSLPEATVDKIVERMDACLQCPMHRRDFCIGCTRAHKVLYKMFDGRRPPLPGDLKSGACACADTFEMAIASVEYHEGAPEWTSAPVPETCWRNRE